MQKIILAIGVLWLTIFAYPFHVHALPAPQIVGGNVIVPNALPFQVFLQIGSARCGGTLINPQWVLTAAHCVSGKDVATMTAHLGVHDKNTLTVAANAFLQSIGIQQKIIHPSYNPATEMNDIALLRLATPATLTTGVQVITLVNSHLSTLYNVGASVVVSGWGITGSGSESQFLQAVELNVISCAVDATVMCTGGSAQIGKGPCNGDSGGPLVGVTSEGFVQAGIVSFIDNADCATSMFAAYTKVASYYSWIQQMGALSVVGTATPTGAIPTEEVIVTASPTHTATYVPVNNNVGSDNSLVLTSDGIPVISYYAATSADLMLAVCNDANCTAPKISVLDQAGDVGSQSSIALTSANVPVIAYYDASNANLKLIVCNDRACTRPAYQVIDAVGNVGTYPTVRMTNTNLPVISYLDMTRSRVKIAVCEDVQCMSVSTQRIEAAGNAYELGVSMALTSANIPVISYISDNDSDLKLLVCSDITCGTPTIRTIATANELGILYPAALQVTSNNNPVLPFFDFDLSALQLTSCGDSSCATKSQTALTGDQGFIFDMKLTTTNIPVISFYHLTSTTAGSLKTYICSNTNCSTKSIVTIDDTGSDEGITADTSLALTTDNRPVMSYYDIKNDNLKLAICANTSCSAVSKKTIDGQAVSGATATTTATHTRTGTATRTVTRTPTNTPTRTSTRTNTATATRTHTRTATATFTASNTRTVTRTPTNTPTRTSTRTNTATATRTRTRTATATFTASNTRTVTRTPTRTLASIIKQP